ncbi:MAG: phage terminase large subunit family protein [Firmicutes bacterium]|jgi:phage terminase large subunit GpA-like protein|nr:phage terminase large subunit family protein [Bacillota bacterium]
MKRKMNKRTEKLFQNIFERYKPPEDLTVSQWAAKNRILSREASAEAGPWNNERTPYLVEIMDALTDPSVREITFVASSQVGKTEGENNFLGYIIDQDPGSVLFIHPTLDDAKKFSKLRIAPMIRDCEALREKVKEAKGRDSGNTVLQKQFPGGMMTLIGSNSASGLASTPVRYVIGDERDRWATSAGTEGDPWELAKARTKTFYNAKLIDVSTPTIKGVSPIESNYQDGTQERWRKECPHCGSFHEIEFDDIHFTPIVKRNGSKKTYYAEDVYWTCPTCGAISLEEEMRKQHGKWVADNPEARARGHRSFWLNGFASPWQRWETILVEFLKAGEDPRKLQVVYNTMLGRTWEERTGTQSEEDLLARREYYGIREDGTPIDLPEGVLVLTCGVDTQDDRLEYEVVGHGYYGETWGIKKGMLMGDPHYPGVWERLDDVTEKIYRYEDRDKGLKIALTFVDSGGHKTQDVYRECRKRFYQNVFAIKGKGGDGIPYTKPPSKVKMILEGRVIGETYLYTIGVDAGKAEIMANVEAKTPGAKYCHFPSEPERGYDETFFSGFLSETKTLETKNGRTRWAWKVLPGHERNEALDCRNYALAALQVLDVDMEAVERRLKGVKDERAKPRKRRKPVRRNRTMESGEW